MTYILLALAVLPVLVLTIFIYSQDKYQKEPAGKLLKAFFFGVLSIIPAILLESLLGSFTPAIPILGGLWDGFVVAGCSEELCKLLMLSLAIWKSREFDEYFDGIVYACFTSLGFACFENVMYVLDAGDFASALQTGTLRAVLSVPAHFLFGVMMGYHFALAKFDTVRRKRHLWHAFLYPMLMHGTFDSLLMIPETVADEGLQMLLGGGLFLVLIFFDVKMWRWGVRRIKRLQELSRQQDFDRGHPFDGFTWDF